MADGDGADHLVVQVQRERPVPGRGHQVQQVDEVLAVEQGGLQRQAGGQVGEADDGDAAPGGDHPAGDRQLGVAARARGHVDDDRARPHALDRLPVEQQRGPAPGDGCRGDDHVGLRGLVGVQGGSGGGLVGGHLGGVAVPGLLLRGGQGDEARAHGLHLLGDLGAHVGAAHDGAQRTGGADPGQPRHAGADDVDARGLELARRRHLPSQGAAQVRRGLDDGAVAGQVRLGGEHVHGLGPGQARHGVHRERGEVARPQVLQQPGATGRVQPADEHRAAAHEAQLPVRRRVGGQDHLAPPCRLRIDQVRARLPVVVVGDVGDGPGAALDTDRVPQGDQLLHRLRRGGNGRLLRLLVRDSYVHDLSSWPQVEGAAARAAAPPRVDEENFKGRVNTCR